MALAELIDQIFYTGDRASSDPEMIVHNLETGLYTAGLMVAELRGQALHGSASGSGSRCDPETLAAGLDGLLAYLGTVERLVAQMDAKVKAGGLLKAKG